MGGSDKKIRGASITVEAALILPLFLIFTMQILSVFEMMSVYSRMEKAVSETAAETAMLLYAFGEPENSRETSFLLSETFIREEIIRKAGAERINNSVISGGIAGLHLFRSDIGVNGEDVKIVLTYRVKPWFSFCGIGKMTLVNHATVKAWNGFERKGTEENGEQSQTVYVTQTGDTYHLYRDCTYLKADSRSVTKAELKNSRNANGGIYYPCKLCNKNDTGKNEIYYISVWGTAYHSDRNCTALEKGVTAIPVKDAGQRHLCSKCAKRSGK